MAPAYRQVTELRAEFAAKEDLIQARLDDFRRVGRLPDRVLFEELCFCLLAIQTRARACDAALRGLVSVGILWQGAEAILAQYLHHRVRFHNHKAAYLVRARDRFFGQDPPTLRATLDRFRAPEETRAWLASEVDGLGFKEASHFLRNIGRGDGLAILDRHILRNLVRHRVVPRVPPSLTRERYLSIEAKMNRFADAVGIPSAALDLLFWSRETGEVFK